MREDQIKKSSNVECERAGLKEMSNAKQKINIRSMTILEKKNENNVGEMVGSNEEGVNKKRRKA